MSGIVSQLKGPSYLADPEGDNGFFSSFRSLTLGTQADGRSILGVQLGPEIPSVDSYADEQETALLEADTFYPEETALKILQALDAVPPSSAFIPPGDPTVPLTPIIPPLLDLGLDFDIVLPQLPSIALKAPDFLEAFELLVSDCDPSLLKGLLVDIQPSLDTPVLEERITSMCPFELPTFELPFPPEFPTLGFSFDFFPIPIGFLFPDLSFPNLNFAMIDIFQAIIDFLLSLPEIIPPLIPQFALGLEPFIQKLIDLCIEKIVIPLQIKLAPLMECSLFVAAFITIIFLAIAFLIVVIIGMFFGVGLIAFCAAHLLGLLDD